MCGRCVMPEKPVMFCSREGEADWSILSISPRALIRTSVYLMKRDLKYFEKIQMGGIRCWKVEIQCLSVQLQVMNSALFLLSLIYSEVCSSYLRMNSSVLLPTFDIRNVDQQLVG